MTDRSEWRLAGGLLLLAALAVVLMMPEGSRSALDPRTSTFRATPRGALGLFLLLEELGIPVERRTTPLVGGGPLPDALVLLAPSESLSPSEVDSLLAWIEGGGNLVYAASAGDTVLAALGLTLEGAFPDSAPASDAGRVAAPVAHAFTTGVDSVYPVRFAFAEDSEALSRGAIPLLRLKDGRTTAVILSRGRGTIMAWSGTGPLANRSLRSSGAGLILARAAGELAASGAALQFDEYHHGFRGGGSPAQVMIGFLRDTSPGRASLQLAIAGLGLLLLRGSRFGSPHPPPPARRRSPLEHLHALATAYEAGGARNRARHLLLVGVARRLGRRPPASGEETEFLAQLASRPGANPDAARSLLETWHNDDAHLADLASTTDRLVAEFLHRQPVEMTGESA